MTGSRTLEVGLRTAALAAAVLVAAEVLTPVVAAELRPFCERKPAWQPCDFDESVECTTTWRPCRRPMTTVAGRDRAVSTPPGQTQSARPLVFALMSRFQM
ncbi:hypothetical protein [Lentzea sp.]|uniref:hypothetical protein n=1 Tax=Lentzea sp. TaxID=56099 RepID=UPI002C9AFE6F|nr:hypothetical protein [Lentzea sp.]HUQ59685.1 hypothetical protein [Lentzea sp.]